MPTAAQLSENSHQGFDGIDAALCLASTKAKSNTASGMPVCLWRKGTGSRSSGKERDAETGLDYFGARYLSAAQGRFITPDWSVNPEPVPYADFRNPQSLNLYSYALNNPLSFKDDDGHCVVDGEKHGWLWCAAHAVGVTQTEKEKEAAIEDERTWLIENVANSESEQDVLKQASSKQISQIYGQWNNAVLSAQSGEVLYQALDFKRADIVNFTVFRGGPLEATAKDVRIDSRTGLLKNTHGVSLNVDWNKITKFGDPHQILSLPPGLQILQRGKDSGHFEIAPLHPGTMSLQQFNQLLQQVVTKLLTP